MVNAPVPCPSSFPAPPCCQLVLWQGGSWGGGSWVPGRGGCEHGSVLQTVHPPPPPLAVVYGRWANRIFCPKTMGVPCIHSSKICYWPAGEGRRFPLAGRWLRALPQILLLAGGGKEGRRLIGRSYKEALLSTCSSLKAGSAGGAGQAGRVEQLEGPGGRWWLASEPRHGHACMHACMQQAGRGARGSRCV